MANDFEKGLAGLEGGPEPSERAGGVAYEEAAPGTHPSVEALRAEFGDLIQQHYIMSRDEHVIYVSADDNVKVLRWLKDDPAQRYDLLKDVTAIDYGGNRPLEVIYELWSIPNRRQLRVKCVLPLRALEIDSVVGLWRTADWLERETYDMFGINFRNHPDLRRILMPENYAEGHPLRKDFPLRGRFSRAEQTRRALSMDVEDHYTPDELNIGGEVSGTADADRRTKEKAERAASGLDNEKDPALGDVSWTQRAPVPGGEASTGASE